jgi:excisionase family DNA binding protein
MTGPAVVANREFLTASQAAVFIGVSRSTVRRAVARGYLAGWHTPGKHLRIARATCLEFALSLGRADLIGRAVPDSATDEEKAFAASGTLRR